MNPSELTYLDESFEAFKVEVTEQVDALSNEIDQLTLPSMEAADIRENFSTTMSNIVTVMQVYQGMVARQSICMDDVLALESRLPEGAFHEVVQQCGIKTFTTEPTYTNYEVSQEGLVKDIGLRIWNMLKAMAKWIWERLVDAWGWVTGLMKNTRVAERKLASATVLQNYIDAVDEAAKNYKPLQKPLEAVRGSKHTQLDKKLGNLGKYYLMKPKEFDMAAEVLGNWVVNYFEPRIKAVDNQITAYNFAQSAKDVYLANDKFKTSAGVDELSVVIGQLQKVFPMAKAKSVIQSIISTMNNIDKHPIRTHPKDAADALKNVSTMSSGTVSAFDKFFTSDMKDIVTRAKETAKSINNIESMTQEVFDAMMEPKTQERLVEQRLVINDTIRLYQILQQMVDARSQVVSALMDVKLEEVKATGKILQQHRNDIPLVEGAKIDTAKKAVFKSLGRG